MNIDRHIITIRTNRFKIQIKEKIGEVDRAV